MRIHEHVVRFVEQRVLAIELLGGEERDDGEAFGGVDLVLAFVRATHLFVGGAALE